MTCGDQDFSQENLGDRETLQGTTGRAGHGKPSGKLGGHWDTLQ